MQPTFAYYDEIVFQDVLEYGTIPIMVFIIYEVVDSTQCVRLINMLITKIKIFQIWNNDKDYL